MDGSSPRPSQRRPAILAQCEGPTRPMQPTCEDYHSDDSDSGICRHDGFANVAAKRSYPGAAKTVNFKPDEDSGYSSYYSAVTMSSADSASMFNNGKSISASSKQSKDSGYHSDPDAIHPGINSRLNSPPAQAVKRRPAIRHDGDMTRTRVDALDPVSLSLNGEMDGRTLDINTAEDGMVEVVIGGSRRSWGENPYSLSSRKPLQRSDSNPSSQSGERGKEKFEECMIPNCTCGPNALSRRPQPDYMSTRGSVIVQPAKTARRRSSSTERLRPRMTSHNNQPPLKYGVSNIPPHPQHTYPPQYPSPPQELHPVRSGPGYRNYYPPFSARHPRPNVSPPGQLSPMCTSQAYGMARPTALHMLPTPPYEQSSLPKSRRPSPISAKKPMVIVQQSPQMPSARYPQPVMTSNQSHYSDSPESESSSDEDRDRRVMPPPMNRPSFSRPSTPIIRQNPTPVAPSMAFVERKREHDPRASRKSSSSSTSFAGNTRERVQSFDSGYKSGSRRSSISRNEYGGRDRLPLEMRRKMAFEAEATHRRDSEGKKNRRLSITRNDDSRETLRDSNKERELLRAQRIGEKKREEEAKEKQERERVERRARRYIERAKKGQRYYEQKERAAEALAIQKFGENAQQQIPKSGDVRLLKLAASPRTDPAWEPQSLLEQSQKLSKPFLAPSTTVGKSFHDILDSNANSQSPEYTVVSVEPQQLFSSLSETSEDIGKTSKPPRNLQPNPKSPILPPRTERLQRTEQLESPQFPSNILAETMICVTGDDNCDIQATAGPAKELVLLSEPSKSSGSVVSSAVDSLSASDRLISNLESSGDSSTSSTEEEHNFVEIDGESDEASEVSKVNMKSALDTAMNVVKSLLLRELMDHALPEAADVLEGSGTSSSGSFAGSASSSASSRTSNSQMPQRRKRTRGNGRDPGDGDGDGSGSDDRPKKKSEKGSPDRRPQRRLKCPFYQRQPEKYTKAACRGEGFADMAKLKDHIKRVHTQPLRCSRCWLEMESEEAYSQHIQKEDICNKKVEPQEDRIRPQILKRLDFKKAPYANARNVEEKWSMLFSVLFPNDTKIPSPYEQQGMNLRLEQALSEALEEELTRELAPVLEPIMSRIKELIPTIIENCRLKLVQPPPSSDDETVFTPSVVSSGIGSSDSEPRSLRKQPKHRCSPTVSQCLGGSFEVVTVPEALSSKTQGKRPQLPALSMATTSVEGRQEVVSPDSNTNFSMFFPDASGEMPNLYESNIVNSFNRGDNITLLSPPGSFPSDGISYGAEGTSAVPANTREISFGPYDFVEGLSQQNGAYWPKLQSSTWLLPEAGWSKGSGAHGQPGGKQPADTNIPREQEPPLDWDLLIKDSEFSHLPNQ